MSAVAVAPALARKPTLAQIDAADLPELYSLLPHLFVECDADRSSGLGGHACASKFDNSAASYNYYRERENAALAFRAKERLERIRLRTELFAEIVELGLSLHELGLWYIEAVKDAHGSLRAAARFLKKPRITLIDRRTRLQKRVLAVDAVISLDTTDNVSVDTATILSTSHDDIAHIEIYADMTPAQLFKRAVTRLQAINARTELLWRVTQLGLSWEEVILWYIEAVLDAYRHRHSMREVSEFLNVKRTTLIYMLKRLRERVLQPADRADLDTAAGATANINVKSLAVGRVEVAGLRIFANSQTPAPRRPVSVAENRTCLARDRLKAMATLPDAQTMYKKFIDEKYAFNDIQVGIVNAAMKAAGHVIRQAARLLGVSVATICKYHDPAKFPDLSVFSTALKMGISPNEFRTGLVDAALAREGSASKAGRLLKIENWQVLYYKSDGERARRTPPKKAAMAAGVGGN